MKRIVPCPTCGKAVEWSSEAKWRPFCSERCKLIDLGEWASEGHRIEGPSTEQSWPEKGEEDEAH